MAITKVKLSDNNVKYTKTINDNFSELDLNKVDKVEGKGLSTNDFTNELKTKLEGVAGGAQVNVIETVKVNGSALTVTDKAVNIEVLTDDDIAKNATVSAMKTKLDTIAENAQVNVIEVVKVNGTPLTPSEKAVNIVIPTTDDINSAIDTKLADYTTTEDLNTALSKKVDKEEGKGLSTNDYTTAEKTKLAGIAEGAQVNVIETVKVNGAALDVTDKAVNVVIPAQSEYTIAEQETAEDGYAKTYTLTKDGAVVGAKINIPKDLVVSKGSVKVVDTTDTPYTGAKVGDKYVDLELNDPTKSHIYIPVQDLVDVYVSGNGVEVAADNKLNAVVDSTNANGLSVGANGIALSVATTDAAGAMSAADKTKLDNIEESADVNIIEKVKVNGSELTPDGEKAVDVLVPTSIFNKVVASGKTLTAASTTDSFEIAAGNNITIAVDEDAKKVTINGVVPEQGTILLTASFSSADEGWGAIDEDGNYTLTLDNPGTPLVVKKLAAAGGYESCMANVRNDGTKIYITSDAKFDGQIIYY